MSKEKRQEIIEKALEPTVCSKSLRDAIVRVCHKSMQEYADHRVNNAVCEVLEEYSLWLCKNGYIDTDYRDEEPKAIDEFMKEYRKK